MAGRGVHFALSARDARRLQRVQHDDAAVLAFVEALDGRSPARWRFDCDKGWDALHRRFADGTLTWAGGRRPLKLCFIGGAILHEEGMIVSAIEAADVPKVAGALRQIDRDWLRRRYWKIDPKDWRPAVSLEDGLRRTVDALRGACLGPR